MASTFLIFVRVLGGGLALSSTLKDAVCACRDAVGDALRSFARLEIGFRELAGHDATLVAAHHRRDVGHALAAGTNETVQNRGRVLGDQRRAVPPQLQAAVGARGRFHVLERLP